MNHDFHRCGLEAAWLATHIFWFCSKKTVEHSFRNVSALPRERPRVRHIFFEQRSGPCLPAYRYMRGLKWLQSKVHGIPNSSFALRFGINFSKRCAKASARWRAARFNLRRAHPNNFHCVCLKAEHRHSLPGAPRGFPTRCARDNHA